MTTAKLPDPEKEEDLRKKRGSGLAWAGILSFGHCQIQEKKRILRKKRGSPQNQPRLAARPPPLFEGPGQARPAQARDPGLRPLLGSGKKEDPQKKRGSPENQPRLAAGPPPLFEGPSTIATDLVFVPGIQESSLQNRHRPSLRPRNPELRPLPDSEKEDDSQEKKSRHSESEASQIKKKMRKRRDSSFSQPCALSGALGSPQDQPSRWPPDPPPLFGGQGQAKPAPASRIATDLVFVQD